MTETDIEKYIGKQVIVVYELPAQPELKAEGTLTWAEKGVNLLKVTNDAGMIALFVLGNIITIAEK